MPCYISHFDQTATCDVIASWVQEGASTQVIVDNMMQIVMTMHYVYFVQLVALY